MVVRLKQTAATGPANEGIYCCLAGDRDGVIRRKCAGVYNNSGGIFMMATIFLVVYQVTEKMILTLSLSFTQLFLYLEAWH